MPLAIHPDYVSPWVGDRAFTVTGVDHTENLLPGTRNLTITVSHPELIWTTIALDAHVLKWSLDDNPPDEFARHRIKEASFYGHDTYSFDVVVKVPPPPPGTAEAAAGAGAVARGGILVNFVGLQEKGVWPAKKAVKAYGGAAMELFEELDGWLDEKTGGTVDALLMGCVGGVTVI